MLFALFRLPLALLAVTVIGLATHELWDRYFAASLVLRTDPTEIAQQLAQQHRWVEVKWLADFTRDHPAAGDVAHATRLSLEAESQLGSMRERAARFVSGAVTGEPTDLWSLMGSLSLDLFVIGDVRDIAVQGWKQTHYGTGDEVVLALSATGLATTLMPHVDWAPALLKNLKRIGALNAKFVRSLKVTSRQALRTGDYRHLGAVVKDIGEVAWNLGPGPMRAAIPAVETATDLSKLAAAAKFNAPDTYVLSSLFGARGVRRLRADGGNVTILLGSAKMGSRVVKITKKLTGTMGPGWLLSLLTASIALLWWSVRPRRSRRRSATRRHGRTEPILHSVSEPQLKQSSDNHDTAGITPVGQVASIRRG